MISVFIRVIRGLVRCLRWLNLRYLRDLRAIRDVAMGCDGAMASVSIRVICGLQR